MVSFTRRCAALLVVAASVLALPAAASAQADESMGCNSSDFFFKNGLCDGYRPNPTIAVAPKLPRAGKATTFTADSYGRGLTYAWDLDDDGAYDDATGATVTRTLTAGSRRVRVRATDDDGRVGSASVTLATHATNLRPEGTYEVIPASPRAGQPVKVTVHGDDVDGAVARVDLDLDGDGTYEAQLPYDADGVARTVTYATAGERTLRARLVDDEGATSVTTSTLDVHATNVAPTASFTATPAVTNVGEEVSFAAFGRDPDGSVAGYAFDLDGDGTFETDNGGSGAITTRFASGGTKRVGVRVTDDGGAIATRRLTVEVKSDNLPPSVLLTRYKDSRMFTAQASDPDGSGAFEYAWDLDGDGAFDDLAGPQASLAVVPYGRVGETTVGVRVTDRDGATATDTLTVTLADFPPDTPYVFVNPGQPRPGDMVSVGVTTESFDVAKIEWDLDGDGTYAAPAAGNATFTSFATPGTHTMRARVTDHAGRVVVGSGEVNVSPAAGPLAPYVQITGDVRRAGIASNLYATGSPNLSTYAWDTDDDGAFDDGDASWVSPVFATAGEHRVSVRVTDAQGAAFVQRRTLTIHGENRPPAISIGRLAPAGQVQRLQVGENAQLSVNSSGDDELVTWSWDLDDDGAFDDGSDSSASVSFATAGSHRVRVRATDAGGLPAIAELTFQVSGSTPNRAPYVSLASPAGTPRPGTPVTLSASGQDPDGDALTYAWDADGDGAFDDGSGSALQYTYAQPGEYDVSVKASDGRGGERTALRTVAVLAPSELAPVIADFTFPASVRPGRAAEFAARATDTATLTFDLDGDGAFDDVPAPSVFTGYAWTFPDATPVTVAVKATSAAGHSAVRTVQIVPVTENVPPAVDLQGAGTVEPGQSALFFSSALEVDGVAFPTWAWDLDGDGAFDDSDAGSQAKTFSAGTHTIGVRVTDDDGASAAVTRTFTVGTKPPVASFTLGNGFTSTSSDPDGGALSSYAWDLDDDGAFDDATGPTAPAAPGRRRIGLKVRDAGGDIGIRYVLYDVADTGGTGEIRDPILLPGPLDPIPPNPPRIKPLALKLRVPKVKLARLLTHGVTVRTGCESACRASAAIAVDKATAKRLKLRSLELGSGRGGATVTIKLTAKARKALRSVRSVKVRVAVIATGLDGRVGTANLSVTIRR